MPTRQSTSLANRYKVLHTEATSDVDEETEEPTLWREAPAGATPNGWRRPVPKMSRRRRHREARLIQRSTIPEECHVPMVAPKDPRPATEEGGGAQYTQAVEEDWKPYSTSYFLPGRIEGRPVQFLIDTGCTTNLISKRVFDGLPNRVKNDLKESAPHGVQADGSRIPFYGTLTARGRLRDQAIEETFLIGQIREDAILGMPFLVDHHCAIEFRKPALLVDGRPLACTDRHGNQLVSSVQVVRNTRLLPGEEKVVACRVTARTYFPQGLVEGT